MTKKYWLGKIEIDALQIDELAIDRGAFITIMGPSGSGKSTLLNIIGGLDSPTTGEVIIGGINIANMHEKKLAKIRREKIGFVFQFFNLIPTLSAIENVELPLILQEQSSRKEIHDRAKDVLELVGLGDRLHHHPMELSGGQQQRVAIARALINNPVLVLADEPTGNVDSATGSQIVQLMSWLNKAMEQTFIIVTHDPKVAASAQQILYLTDGRITSSTKVAPRPSNKDSRQEETRFFASELASLRASIDRIQKTKDELPPDLYYQALSLYEKRLQRLTDMMEETSGD